MHIIIHEQNRDNMKQELEVHDSFVTTHKNMDTIEPTKPVNIISYNFCNDQHLITSGVQSTKRAPVWLQGNNTLVVKYTNELDTSIIVSEECGT